MFKGVLLAGASLWVPFAAADYDRGTGCTFEEFSLTNVITADIASAKVGDVVGRFEQRSLVPFGCNRGSSVRATVHLPLQPRGANNFTCPTTVPGISLSLAGTANTCQNTRNRYPIGPAIFAISHQVARYPFTYTQSFNYVKTAQVPPGVYSLAPANLAGLSVHYSDIYNGYTQTNFTAQVTTGPVEIIGTTCSLVTSNVVVDFGEFSDDNASKDFQIIFDSCTSGADALAYNQAVSFKFTSDRIRPDGSALLNGNCAHCAKGIQVALQDGSGQDINLAQPFKLASNGSVAIRPDGLVHNFRARIKTNPDQPRAPGLLDTQLTFETVIE